MTARSIRRPSRPTCGAAWPTTACCASSSRSSSSGSWPSCSGCDMGKRSSFERIPRDFYPTPYAAVPPLIPHLRGVRTFAEPCCGDGALVRHLESHGLRCAYQGDISTGQDALGLEYYGEVDAIITNPPYTRPVMHALIGHFTRILPTWLLLETDWASTKQAAPFMPSCTDLVSVGRLRWIEGTKMSGK